ncbi:MAG: carboxypeptidase regulatory-like domain-containing protein [Cytophagaceae bacterium]|nr:carboxypeptidase regulatory-like domain-containing protein [Gemmatimonadaceae bacterium]
MEARTMTKIAVPLVLVLMGWCTWPRNTHDFTIVDGRVLTMTGAPVAGARVRVGFPISETGGGDEDSTDADGCFHLHARHSSRDRNAFLSVEHADFTKWSRKRRDATWMTAMVHLDTVGRRSKGGGWLRPRELQDTSLQPCREQPTRVATPP